MVFLSEGVSGNGVNDDVPSVDAAGVEVAAREVVSNGGDDAAPEASADVATGVDAPPDGEESRRSRPGSVAALAAALDIPVGPPPTVKPASQRRQHADGGQPAPVSGGGTDDSQPKRGSVRALAGALNIPVGALAPGGRPPPRPKPKPVVNPDAGETQRTGSVRDLANKLNIPMGLPGAPPRAPSGKEARKGDESKGTLVHATRQRPQGKSGRRPPTLRRRGRNTSTTGGVTVRVASQHVYLYLKRHADVQAWLESLLGERFGTDLHAALASGERLCAAANALVPGAIMQVSASGELFHRMENVGRFLAWAEAYGMDKDELFEPRDLVERANFFAVVSALFSLAWHVERSGGGPVGLASIGAGSSGASFDAGA